MEEIGQEEVETAMHNMKQDKATGADEVRLEMMKVAGQVGVTWTGRLLKVCTQEGRMAPGEYRRCGGWGASVHSITGNHQQEDGVEGCHGGVVFGGKSEWRRSEFGVRIIEYTAEYRRIDEYSFVIYNTCSIGACAYRVILDKL